MAKKGCIFVPGEIRKAFDQIYKDLAGKGHEVLFVKGEEVDRLAMSFMQTIPTIDGKKMDGMTTADLLQKIGFEGETDIFVVDKAPFFSIAKLKDTHLVFNEQGIQILQAMDGSAELIWLDHPLGDVNKKHNSHEQKIKLIEEYARAQGLIDRTGSDWQTYAWNVVAEQSSPKPQAQGSGTDWRWKGQRAFRWDHQLHAASKQAASAGTEGETGGEQPGDSGNTEEGVRSPKHEASAFKWYSSRNKTKPGLNFDEQPKEFLSIFKGSDGNYTIPASDVFEQLVFSVGKSRLKSEDRYKIIDMAYKELYNTNSAPPEIIANELINKIVDAVKGRERAIQEINKIEDKQKRKKEEERLKREQEVIFRGHRDLMSSAMTTKLANSVASFLDRNRNADPDWLSKFESKAGELGKKILNASTYSKLIDATINADNHINSIFSSYEASRSQVKVKNDVIVGGHGMKPDGVQFATLKAQMDAVISSEALKQGRAIGTTGEGAIEKIKQNIMSMPWKDLSDLLKTANPKVFHVNGVPVSPSVVKRVLNYRQNDVTPDKTNFAKRSLDMARSMLRILTKLGALSHVAYNAILKKASNAKTRDDFELIKSRIQTMIANSTALAELKKLKLDIANLGKMKFVTPIMKSLGNLLNGINPNGLFDSSSPWATEKVKSAKRLLGKWIDINDAVKASMDPASSDKIPSDIAVPVRRNTKGMTAEEANVAEKEYQEKLKNWKESERKKIIEKLGQMLHESDLAREAARIEAAKAKEEKEMGAEVAKKKNSIAISQYNIPTVSFISNLISSDVSVETLRAIHTINGSMIGLARMIAGRVSGEYRNAVSIDAPIFPGKTIEEAESMYGEISVAMKLINLLNSSIKLRKKYDKASQEYNKLIEKLSAKASDSPEGDKSKTPVNPAQLPTAEQIRTLREGLEGISALKDSGGKGIEQRLRESVSDLLEKAKFNWVTPETSGKIAEALIEKVKAEKELQSVIDAANAGIKKLYIPGEVIATTESTAKDIKSIIEKINTAKKATKNALSQNLWFDKHEKDNFVKKTLARLDMVEPAMYEQFFAENPDAGSILNMEQVIKSLAFASKNATPKSKKVAPELDPTNESLSVLLSAAESAMKLGSIIGRPEIKEMADETISDVKSILGKIESGLKVNVRSELNEVAEKIQKWMLPDVSEMKLHGKPPAKPFVEDWNWIRGYYGPRLVSMAIDSPKEFKQFANYIMNTLGGDLASMNPVFRDKYLVDPQAAAASVDFDSMDNEFMTKDVNNVRYSEANISDVKNIRGINKFLNSYLIKISDWIVGNYTQSTRGVDKYSRSNLNHYLLFNNLADFFNKYRRRDKSNRKNDKELRSGSLRAYDQIASIFKKIETTSKAKSDLLKAEMLEAMEGRLLSDRESARLGIYAIMNQSSADFVQTVLSNVDSIISRQGLNVIPGDWNTRKIHIGDKPHSPGKIAFEMAKNIVGVKDVTKDRDSGFVELAVDKDAYQEFMALRTLQSMLLLAGSKSEYQTARIDENGRIEIPEKSGGKDIATLREYNAMLDELEKSHPSLVGVTEFDPAPEGKSQKFPVGVKIKYIKKVPASLLNESQAKLYNFMRQKLDAMEEDSRYVAESVMDGQDASTPNIWRRIDNYFPMRALVRMSDTTRDASSLGADLLEEIASGKDPEGIVATRPAWGKEAGSLQRRMNSGDVIYDFDAITGFINHMKKTSETLETIRDVKVLKKVLDPKNPSMKINPEVTRLLRNYVGERITAHTLNYRRPLMLEIMNNLRNKIYMATLIKGTQFFKQFMGTVAATFKSILKNGPANTLRAAKPASKIIAIHALKVIDAAIPILNTAERVSAFIKDDVMEAFEKVQFERGTLGGDLKPNETNVYPVSGISARFYKEAAKKTRIGAALRAGQKAHDYLANFVNSLRDLILGASDESGRMMRWASTIMDWYEKKGVNPNDIDWSNIDRDAKLEAENAMDDWYGQTVGALRFTGQKDVDLAKMILSGGTSAGTLAFATLSRMFRSIVGVYSNKFWNDVQIAANSRYTEEERKDAAKDIAIRIVEGMAVTMVGKMAFSRLIIELTGGEDEETRRRRRMGSQVKKQKDLEKEHFMKKWFGIDDAKDFSKEVASQSILELMLGRLDNVTHEVFRLALGTLEDYALHGGRERKDAVAMYNNRLKEMKKTNPSIHLIDEKGVPAKVKQKRHGADLDKILKDMVYSRSSSFSGGLSAIQLFRQRGSQILPQVAGLTSGQTPLKMAIDLATMLIDSGARHNPQSRPILFQVLTFMASEVFPVGISSDIMKALASSTPEIHLGDPLSFGKSGLLNYKSWAKNAREADSKIDELLNANPEVLAAKKLRPSLDPNYNRQYVIAQKGSSAKEKSGRVPKKDMIKILSDLDKLSKPGSILLRQPGFPPAGEGPVKIDMKRLYEQTRDEKKNLKEKKKSERESGSKEIGNVIDE
jgi:hypothetical protein